MATPCSTWQQVKDASWTWADTKSSGFTWNALFEFFCLLGSLFRSIHRIPQFRARPK